MSTPFPGNKLPLDEARRVGNLLQTKFQLDRPSYYPAGVPVPSNLPLACRLNGPEIESDILRSATFLNSKDLYFYLEQSQDLFVADSEQIVHYINSKQPWEDYDICIADSQLAWCLSLTHNGKFYLADPDNHFRV